MKLDALYYLLEIRKCCSITQAAEKFYTSHQNISNSIKSLEKELGVTLLTRSSRGVTLTSAGIKACQFAETVITAKSLLDTELAEFKQELPRECMNVTIHATSRYITESFLNLLNTMQKEDGSINLFLKNSSAQNIFFNTFIDQNSIGLFTTCSPLTQKEIDSLSARGLKYQLLSKELLQYCFYKTHPLASRNHLSWKSISQYPVIGFNYSIIQHDGDCSSIFKNMDAYDEQQYSIESFEQQKAILKQGKAFAIYTEREFNDMFSNNYLLIPKEEPVWMYFYAIFATESVDNISTLLNKIELYFSNNSC